MDVFIHRRGFTLMEVNLAIFIMAVAVLGMVALYPLGFRESEQSRDDVVAAAVADGILNPLVAALSATNITWNSWKNLAKGRAGNQNGWEDYCQDAKHFIPKDLGSINSKTREVATRIGGVVPNANPETDVGTVIDAGKMACALVVSPGRVITGTGSGEFSVGGRHYDYDYSRLVLSLRVASRAQQLCQSPIYCAEVHYQGDSNQCSPKGTGVDLRSSRSWWPRCS